MSFRNRLTCLLSVLVLAACGGGGSNNNDSSPPPASMTTGSVDGTAVASDSGLPLADVQVTVAGKTVITTNTGSFKHDGIATSDRVVLRFAKNGYVDAFATTPVNAAGAASIVARLAPISARTTFDNGAGATLVDTASPAQVSFAPASLVNDATGAAPVGQVTASIAVIDPSTNPANMPGDYTTSAGNTIESFGALSVQLRDSAGNRLNLAPNQTSTIRIPLLTRSASSPQTIPLYYFNEISGLWVEEGSARLSGTAPNQYYEGTVSHFTVWNADIAIETVFVNGCLVDPEGQPLITNIVRSEGVDYSGFASSASDAQGKFRVAIRRNGTAKIEAVGLRTSSAALAGPSASDITLPACLTLQPSGTPVKPALLIEPRSTSAQINGTAAFVTFATGADLKYEWLRNGQPIAGATRPVYTLSPVSAADNNAQFSVRISNTAGSVTSRAATLTVVEGQSVDTTNLSRLIYLPLELFDLGTTPLSYFTSNKGDTWTDPAAACATGSASGTLNGQAIPVNTVVAAGSGTVTGTFNNCVSNANDPDAVLNGSATVSYTTDAGFRNGSATSQIVNMRRVYTASSPFDANRDITGNGSISLSTTTTVSGGNETSDSSVTPGANSTLRSNLTGKTATFVSGSLRVTTVETLATQQLQTTLEQNNLAYTLNGDTYVANGAIRFATSANGAGGSGQIVLTKNGSQAGRIFATPEGLKYEVNGTIEPFGQAGTPLARVFKAKAIR